MASKGSFAQRAAAAAMASPQIENWDDDLDFQGDIFTNSVSTVQTSLSSRVSVRSESVAGDDDWHVLIAPNDELSKQNAISSAKQAGIPIPSNVPSSALLGGSIKRLGKKASKPKIVADDDWGDDLELPTDGNALKLKAPQLPRTPATPADQDDSEDWGEGSLGIRFAGTRRDGRNRSSSVSAMSPSMGSCMTVESEDDDLTGLVLPNEPLDFKARLGKLKLRDEEPPAPAPTSAPTDKPSSEAPSEPTPQPKPAEEAEDFFADIDLGNGDLVDAKKLTLNRNLKIETHRSHTPTLRHVSTTLTFTDKPAASRIPRPLPTNKPSRLDPVYESGAAHPSRLRPAPTTTTAQLLKAKRSAPVLRSHYNPPTKPSAPFLPAGSSLQSHHASSKPSSHFRRDSDPNRAKSPALRSYSRMSAANPPDTPNRPTSRKDTAPSSLAREAASKRLFTKPVRRRLYGDGSELDLFDDLPTSATKENKFVKVPANRATPKPLRQQPSFSRLPTAERTTTPHPPATPRSPTKADSTPRFARDTAASRIAREQRLAGTRSRAEGQVMPVHTNWKAQVAARSPHNSPTSVRNRRGSGQKPHLIKPMSTPMAKNEKGMTYNPILQRWEGNEAALLYFNHPNMSSTTLASATLTPALSTPTFAPHGHHQSAYHHQHSHSNPYNSYFTQQPHPPANPPSPPRPALISHISSARGVQVERGMVFDPARMCWLKLVPSRHDPHALSPSIDPDEDDPFAGLEDLKDDTSRISIGAGGPAMLNTGNQPPSLVGGGGAAATGGFDDAFAPEEFDVGPEFIRRQEMEEQVWRRRVEAWVGGQRDLIVGQGWRWAIRDLAVAAEQRGGRY